MLYTFQLITIKFTENTQLIKATIKNAIEKITRRTTEESQLTLHELQWNSCHDDQHVTYVGRAKYEKNHAIPHYLLCQLSAWADDLRGALMHPCGQKKK